MKSRKSTIHPSADPAMQALLKRFPTAIANSFTTEPLCALAAVMGPGGPYSCRGYALYHQTSVCPVQFLSGFPDGPEPAGLSKSEQAFALFSMLIFVVISFTLLAGFTLFMMYLLKSALGIDLVSDFSTGIWEWYHR
ncbi:hypothetical protein HHX48_13610 [Salinimonas sp. HHU 13199]|uniref:Uncharacterized protein n=1 Tax=Salinimonas profundi TaxID=2729140 RepID=A0ABR8LMH9_9ALTE|nr:hypothetical protein [Salinimonas profundi]MBD3586778.1 hypothetical protein [Salinimonas profundi]